jgi:hypothetical protein
MAQTGDVMNWSSDSDGDTLPIKDTIQTNTIVDEVVIHKDVGMKIARDFGNKGVFLGEVVAVEYDSEDVDKNEDIFVVEYTDGDHEDMNKDEVVYANELYVQESGLMTTRLRGRFTRNRAKRKVMCHLLRSGRYFESNLLSSYELMSYYLFHIA